MSVIQSIKARLGFSTDTVSAIDYMPSERRDEQIPKFKLRKDVNEQGGIYLPKDVRTFDKRSNVKAGDRYSLDIFTADEREMFVDVSVNKGNRITIPAETRHSLDIQPDDTIAVHAYWLESK